MNKQRFAETVADHMVQVGTDETSEGNYCFYLGASDRTMPYDDDLVRDALPLILDVLASDYSDVVADVQVYTDDKWDCIDMMFYLAYCPNANYDEDEEYGDETTPLPTIPRGEGAEVRYLIGYNPVHEFFDTLAEAQARSKEMDRLTTIVDLCTQ